MPPRSRDCCYPDCPERRWHPRDAAATFTILSRQTSRRVDVQAFLLSPRCCFLIARTHMNSLPIALYRVICYGSSVPVFLYFPVFLLELEGISYRTHAQGESVSVALLTNLALVAIVGISWRVTVRGDLKRWLGRFLTPATMARNWSCAVRAGCWISVKTHIR